MEYIKAKMDEHWEPLSREMVLKSDSRYYDADNPLIALRDNAQNLVASGVLKLIDEQPDRVDEILSTFLTEDALADPEKLAKNADDMLHNAVKLTMQTMNYEEVAAVLNSASACEDFKHDRFNNFRAKDFDRKKNNKKLHKNPYGYLNKSLKSLVDEIVDQIGEIDVISECYSRWQVLQGKVEGYYDSQAYTPKPLSQEKTFHALKNMVIQEADNYP